jgi:DNA polymerase III subunit epsilon
MTREIILDTETTGFKPEEGHRIVEIGAVELVNHIPTGEFFHVYINPEMAMPKDAESVHGLSDKFLKDKPVFKAIADDFLRFIGDAPLVIHNADFDMEFLNAELGYLGFETLPKARAIDTVAMARKKFPMAPASLDALCKRFGIDNSKRTKHGALLDAELLAEVYLELIGGRQTTFGLGVAATKTRQTFSMAERVARKRERPLASRLTDDERKAHMAMVASLGEASLWSKTSD